MQPIDKKDFLVGVWVINDITGECYDAHSTEINIRAINGTIHRSELRLVNCVPFHSSFTDVTVVINGLPYIVTDKTTLARYVCLDISLCSSGHQQIMGTLWHTIQNCNMNILPQAVPAKGTLPNVPKDLNKEKVIEGIKGINSTVTLEVEGNGWKPDKLRDDVDPIKIIRGMQ